MPIGDMNGFYHDYWLQARPASYYTYSYVTHVDKGTKAFEIIKALKDKKLVKINDVDDFMSFMDELIKVL